MHSILYSVSLDERQQRCLEELVALISPDWARIKNHHCKRRGDILDYDEIDEVMTDALIIVVMKWESVFDPQGFFRSTVHLKMREAVQTKRKRQSREILQESWQDIKDCSLSDMQERYAHEAWQEERERALYQALTTLNDIDLQAIIMRYYGNRSYSEIALCLGRTPDVWRKRMHWIRASKLKPAIDHYLAASQIH